MTPASRRLRNHRRPQNSAHPTRRRPLFETLENRSLLAGFNFANFNDSSGLNLEGSAAITADNRLRLTPAIGGQSGAAWYTAEKQFVASTFSTTFQFQLADNFDSPGGSDGFVFALQNSNPTFLGGGGGNLGYSSLADSLVIEFDTFQNSELGDTSPSSISVHTGGIAGNYVNESYSLGHYDTNPIMDDANVHAVNISYQPGALSIYLDNMTTPVLNVPVDLADKLNLSDGRAWVGFTAATGGGYQTHDILNWNLDVPFIPATTVGIGDAAQIEGNSGPSNLTFTVTRSGDISGTTTVNWTTADGTATAGSDYVAAASQLTFNPLETTKTISIVVNGDTTVEPNEAFFLKLSNAVGGTITDGTGTGTILNDEATIAVSDATATEGSTTYRFTDNFVAPDAYGLATARNMEVGPDGNVYVASHDTDVVKVFEGGTGRFLRNLATSGGELDGPWGMRFGPDGRLYVGGRYSLNIVRFDVANGNYDVFVPAAASGGLGIPKGIAFGPDGNLYASSHINGDLTTNDVVKRYNGATGAYLGNFVAPGSGGLNNANGIVFGPDGNLYVSSTAGRQVLRYNGQTGAFMNVFIDVGTAGLGNPTFLRFRSDGLVYVADNAIPQVLRYNAATGAFVDVVAPSLSISPLGVAFSTTGELLVALGPATGQLGSAVRRYATGDQAAFTVSLSAPLGVRTSINFSTSNGSALAGSDYVAYSGTIDFAPGETTRTILVRAIDDSVGENTETFAVNLSGASTGVTIVDSQGIGTIIDNDPGPTKFYVPNDGSSDRTFEYTATGTPVENYTIATGNTAPRGAASNIVGDKVWVIDANRNVYVYNTSGGLLGSWAFGGLTNTAQVEGIATNGIDIWIVDAKSAKVFRYTGAASRTW